MKKTVIVVKAEVRPFTSHLCSSQWFGTHVMPMNEPVLFQFDGRNPLFLELLTRWLVVQVELWKNPFVFEIIWGFWLPGGVLLPCGMSGSDSGGGHAHPSGACEGRAGEVPAIQRCLHCSQERKGRAQSGEALNGTEGGQLHKPPIYTLVSYPLLERKKSYPPNNSLNV